MIVQLTMMTNWKYLLMGGKVTCFQVQRMK